METSGIKELNRKVGEESLFVAELKREIAKVIVGQDEALDRILVALIAGGHVLLEGVPGLAKTLTIKTLAACVSATFSRIQFTPDLLPADLTGTLILDPKSGDFKPRLGPVFANLILADEINRAPAKVQSALLEAMQEHQVTIGSATHSLPDPFLVLATQNPIEQEGTYPLPEAQVDRFMLKIRLGYPSKAEEKSILERMAGEVPPAPQKVTTPAQLLRARQVASGLYLDEKIKDYIVELVYATREPEKHKLGAHKHLIAYGASPRATIALAQAAKAYAFMNARGYVTPEDVKAIGPDVLRHRILVSYEAEAENIDISSTGWSVYEMFWVKTDRLRQSISQSILFMLTHHSVGGIYLDVAAGVTTFLLVGRYFEAWSRQRSGNALRALADVGAKDVGVIDATGFERRRPVAELGVGDRFIVRPGETIATDGEVVFGQSAVDRSVMTGEFQPLDVSQGDLVVGGTISVNGRLVVRATKVGRDTQLAQMLALVEHAQNEKAAVQRLADRVANVFVPGVILIALGTLAAWLLLGYPGAEAFTAALSVLVIACPCALGLATPAALYVASAEGARVGIFFKGYRALEASRQVDTVVLDKTGTLTQGKMTMTDIASVPGQDPTTLLRWAGALEQASEHPVAVAIAARAVADLGSLPEVQSFVAVAGLGASGIVDGHKITIGRADWQKAPSSNQQTEIDETGMDNTDVEDQCAEWERHGRTAVRVCCDGRVIGSIALADTIRESALPAVRELQGIGLHCALITGDNEATARAVADSLGITEVVAGALPAEKVAFIQHLQAEGHSVAMVGDGVNDGPALVVADLGLAVGSGTDVAINAADLIVVRDDLRSVATAIDLSRRTLRTIHSNLAWACIYNLAAIPLAAFGFLNPLIAAGAMALSSGFVVWNSSRLRHVARPNPSGRRSAHSGASKPAVAMAGVKNHG